MRVQRRESKTTKRCDNKSRGLAQTFRSAALGTSHGVILWRRDPPARAGAERSLCAPKRSTQPVHPQDRRLVEIIKPETRPRPLVRRTHQPSLHRIIVHVIQFLEALLFAINTLPPNRGHDARQYNAWSLSSYTRTTTRRANALRQPANFVRPEPIWLCNAGDCVVSCLPVAGFTPTATVVFARASAGRSRIIR